MFKNSLAGALQWWLVKQSKFDGATVCTKQVMTYDEVSGKELSGTDNFIIDKWIVNDVEQPDDKQIVQIISDYEASIYSSASKKSMDKSVVLAKLGISAEELKELLS